MLKWHGSRDEPSGFSRDKVEHGHLWSKIERTDHDKISNMNQKVLYNNKVWKDQPTPAY